MRLIHADSLEVHTFNDESQLPPYAILSHTWGSAEVSFQAFAHVRQTVIYGALTEGQGCWKIVKACQQALEDGLDYVWVDTCCIDKTSSAELSEAINSMFRWYKNAVVCYAYLDDVEVDPKAGTDGGSQSDGRFSIDELEKARWFTRGWTLQELIAPKRLEFYGKGWEFIDYKLQLCDILEEITGISIYVLRAGDLQYESIAKRMSWMARRQTTRAEDLAYSLLGIFGVNMPLLYGEGDKAFVRLQEEIMKDSADHTLFTWNIRGNRQDLIEHGPYRSSIFAKHPSQFAHSSGMSRLWFDEEYTKSESYALTNLGVQIKLRIIPYEKPELKGRYTGQTFVAMLDCRYESGPLSKACRPGIFLEQLSPYSTQFTRIENAGIIPVVPDGMVDNSLTRLGALSFGSAAPRSMYLPKKLPNWAQETREVIEDTKSAKSVARGSFGESMNVLPSGKETVDKHRVLETQ